MKPRQLAIIWVGALLVAGTALYPPWACVGRQGIGAAVGYHWFFAPPEGECLAASVDFSRLLIQWVVVAALAAALYWAWPPPAFFTRISRIFARSFKIFVAFYRLVLTAAPVLIFGAVCLGFLYMVCEALQPSLESVLPSGLVPKNVRGLPWLFTCILIAAWMIWEQIDDIRKRRSNKRHSA